MKKIYVVSLAIGGVAVIGVVVLVVAMAVLSKSCLPTNSALVEPRPAQATILEAKETGLIVDQYAGVRFRLEVRPPAGEPFQVTVTRAVSRFNLAQYKPGATLKINYDNTDRSRVRLISEPQPPAPPSGK